MGFFDAAGEQFQLAFEKGQEPFEAAFMLGLFFKQNNKWNEACRVFERALGGRRISEESKREAKYELSLVFKELGKTEVALQLLREVSVMDHEFLTGKDEAVPPAHKPDSGKNRLKIKTGG